MAKSSPQRSDPWIDAVLHLRGVDTAWSATIDRVGPCLLRPGLPRDRFGTLVRAIIGQQISSKAATSIDRKLRSLAGEVHEPKTLLDLGEDSLRSVGISGVKARSILDLAGKVHAGELALEKVHRLDDDAIIARLTSVKGIGPWTAEMFLIFCLGRPDILPVADLGIRMAIRDWFNLTTMPKPDECRMLTEGWRPYRTVASWYLWRDKDTARKATTTIPIKRPKAADGKASEPK